MPRHASIEWADEPVSTANDKLGRSLQARAMAEKINKDHSWDQSRVYGLTGSWGSGKTSMINMIVDELRRQPDGSPPWAIAHFTPWSANDADTLVQEFYAALAERLPNRSPARQKIVNLAVAASPLLNAIPIIGGGVEAAMVGVLERLGETGPWQAQFDAACTALRETKQRMLIIADDIDRLQTAELFTLLKVVRLLGRFPGVSYLLAYDEETLLTNLTVTGAGGPDRSRARQFMEKIVQCQLPVPILTQVGTLAMLDQQLTDALSHTGRSVPEVEYARLSSVSEALEGQLRTPRAIGRLAAQVRLNLTFLPANEINDIDLILLTLVQLSFPDLYAALPLFRTELTGGKTQREWVKNSQNGSPVDCRTSLLNSVSERDRDDAADLLSELFPSLASGPSLARQRGVGDPDYFDRYFVHGIPDHDVSDTEAITIIAQAAHEGALSDLTWQLGSSTQPRVDALLRKLSRLTDLDSKDGVSVTAPLVGAVLAALPRLDDRGISSARWRAMTWAARATLTVVTVDLDGLIKVYESADLTSALVVIDRSLDMDTHDSTEWPSGLRIIATKLAQRAAGVFLEGLIKRDQDDQDIPYLRYLAHIREHGDCAELAEQTKALLAGGSTTEEDVAARCVRIESMVSPIESRELQGGDRALLTMVLDSGAPFFDLPMQPGLSQTDLSWPNRRAYSRGRFSEEPGHATPRPS